MFAHYLSILVAFLVLRPTVAQPAIAANRALQIVKAGGAPFEVIAVLRNARNGIVEVCPEIYPDGISIYLVARIISGRGPVTS